MGQIAPDIIDWLQVHALPFEAEFRLRLRRVCSDAHEIDDVIQEVYLRLLDLREVAEIREPRGYLMQMAKNLVLDRLRHEAVLRIDVPDDLEQLAVADPAAGPERVALARAELDWVLRQIARLPRRCRQVVRARRLYGWSQQVTAQMLGLSENVVEKETMKGMALIDRQLHQKRGQPLARTVPKTGA